MSESIWWLPSPEDEGSLVFGAHGVPECKGQDCALHNPSDHWAAGMPMRWVPPVRKDGKLSEFPRMERRCPHGGWHDDPDDLAFRFRVGWAVKERECWCDCNCDCSQYVPF